MRSIMFSALISLVALLVSYGQIVQAANTKTVVLDVPGMTCKFCPITIRKSLKKVPGVLDAKSDFDSKSATVTYDADITIVESLTNATENAGYPSSLKQK